MARILIAEDEARIAGFLEKGLRATGFATTTVTDGVAAYDYARSGSFDLLVLDIGLPGLDGFEVLDRLRRLGADLPVIILTARDSAADAVAGLQGGANDYMRKPFSFDELLARVRLQLRRPGKAEETLLKAGDLTLDRLTRRALVGGRTVALTTREFDLTELFVRHRDQVLAREQILDHVWGFDFDPGSNVVDVYVRYLRRKLGVTRIETVRGAGYRLRAMPEPTAETDQAGPTG